MKKIKNIKEELGYVTLNLKNGTKQKVLSKTVYTFYDDNTNDCRIEIEKPLDLRGNQQEVK